jgi:SAM-dependent methyltransferase
LNSIFRLSINLETTRIISTEYPFSYSRANRKHYRRIDESLKQQKAIERKRLTNYENVINSGSRSDINIDRCEFNIGSTALLTNLSNLLFGELIPQGLGARLPGKYSNVPKINILDLGGGVGKLMFIIRGLIYSYRQGNLTLSLENSDIVVSNLVDFFNFLFPPMATGITDRSGVRGVIMSAEFPHLKFYNYFDIIVAQNSIFHHSLWPELCLTNVFKMLKAGGDFLATTPPKLKRKICDQSINFHEIIVASELFEIKETYQWGDEYFHMVATTNISKPDPLGTELFRNER